MFGWLLPKEICFFRYFSEHAALIRRAAEELIQENRIDAIEELEAQADLVTHQCVEALRKTFITPLDRHDIFRLIYRMDDILDNMESAARYCQIYKISKSTPQYRELGRLLAIAVEELEKAVNGLSNLKNSGDIIKSCIAINRIENEADLLLAQILEELFEKETDLRLVIKLKEIYGFLETAIDRCEDVANLIEGIILEYS